MSTLDTKTKVSVSGSNSVSFVCKNESCERTFCLQKSLSRHEKICKKQKKEELEPQDRSKNRTNVLDEIFSSEITDELGDCIVSLFNKCLRDCNLTRLSESDLEELSRYHMVLDGTVKGDSIEYVLTACLLGLEKWRVEQSIIFDIETIKKLMKVIDMLRQKSVKVRNKRMQQS